MANMIIRPAADGNLLIQDRAGGAVLSTGTSGATVANATLTAPTIANMANCTFPAKHVTEMFHYIENAGVSVSNSNVQVGFGTIRSQAVVNGAKCLISMAGGVVPAIDPTTFGTWVGIRYKVGSTFTSTTDGSSINGAYHIGLNVGSSGGGVNIKSGGIGGSYLYENTSGSTQTIYFRPSASSIGSGYTGSWGGSPDHHIHITVIYVR